MQAQLVWLLVGLSLLGGQKQPTQAPHLPRPEFKGSYLVRNTWVQDELKLTAQQRTIITDLANAPAKPNTDWQARDRNLANRVNQMLNSSQKQRLWQLGLQQAGPAGVRNAEAARRLRITAAQDKQIVALLVAHQKKVAEIYKASSSFQPDPQKPESMEKYRKLQAAAAAKATPLYKALKEQILGVLTPAQRKALSALKGQPAYSLISGASYIRDIETPLIAQSLVQTDIGLTPKQGKAIRDALIKTAQSKPAESSGQRYLAAARRFISGLTSKQKQRLRQIALQVGGPRTCLSSEVGTALGITADQADELKIVLNKIEQDRPLPAYPPLPKQPSGKFKNASEQRAAMAKYQAAMKAYQARVIKLQAEDQKARDKHRARVEAAILSTLTPVQRAKFKSMQGKPLAGLATLRSGRP